ncbi:MAG: MFS transporter [Granulosicoccus sp.]
MRNFSSILVTLVLWVAGLCAAAQFAKMGLFLPELQQLYPEAGVATGFLITLISLVGALLGLVAGILVGRIGARSVLLGGLLIGALISLVQSIYLPLSLLLASRMVEGFSHLAIVVAAPTLMSRYCSERLSAVAMTLWGTFFGVSFALTASLGLPLVETQGIHVLFLAHALILSVTTALVALLVPKQRAVSNDETRSHQSDSIASLFQRHKQAWLSPYIAAPAAGWLFYTTTFVALLAILPSLMPLDQRAFVASAMPLASIFSSMTLGAALLLRFSAVHVVNIGFIAALSLALLFLIGTYEALICVLLFSALGLVQGASFAAIPQLNTTASKQALAYGALAQAGNIGNLCGTPLLLFLINYGGTKAMIALVVTCYTMAICAHLSFDRRRKCRI